MVEKYWQKCYSHSPDKEEITLFQTQWEEKSWNAIQDGLMCQKAFIFFFLFSYTDWSFTKTLSLLTSLDVHSTTTCCTIFSLNLQQHVLSVLGWSLCALSSEWLLEMRNLVRLCWSTPAAQGQLSPGTVDSQLFLNPFQSFLTLDIFLTYQALWWAFNNINISGDP